MADVGSQPTRCRRGMRKVLHVVGNKSTGWMSVWAPSMAGVMPDVSVVFQGQIHCFSGLFTLCTLQSLFPAELFKLWGHRKICNTYGFKNKHRRKKTKDVQHWCVSNIQLTVYFWAEVVSNKVNVLKYSFCGSVVWVLVVKTYFHFYIWNSIIFTPL